LLGGLWHGAAWLFVFWGGWHGLLLVGFHVLKRRGLVLSSDRLLGNWLNRQVTFLLVVAGWVLFRAADIREGNYGLTSIFPAFRMFGAMIGLGGLAPRGAPVVPGNLSWLLALCWVWCNFVPNTTEVFYQMAFQRKRYAALAGLALGVCVIKFGTPVDFLYFRF